MDHNEGEGLRRKMRVVVVSLFMLFVFLVIRAAMEKNGGSHFATVNFSNGGL
jgi:hypothetical protein